MLRPENATKRYISSVHHIELVIRPGGTTPITSSQPEASQERNYVYFLILCNTC